MNAIVTKPESHVPALRGSTARPLVPQSMDEMYRMATAIVRAGMQPKSFGEGERAQAACFVAMQLGAEVGFPPMAAIQNIAVINGKPGVYGPAQMALVRASGLLEAIEEKFTGKEDADDWTAVCTVKRLGQIPETATFSVADAKKAGLWGKQGPWVQYRKRMLRMRARGFALRDVFPDVLLGLTYSMEELGDMHVGPDNARQVTQPARPAIAEGGPKSKLEQLEHLTVGDGSGDAPAHDADGVVTDAGAQPEQPEALEPEETAAADTAPAAAPPAAMENRVLNEIIAEIKAAETVETLKHIADGAADQVEFMSAPDRKRFESVVALRRRELTGKR